MALISDGLGEYEVLDDGAIAVTLVRGVGALSRNDLPERPGHAGWPVPTPAAQCLGRYRAEFALLPHGTNDDAIGARRAFRYTIEHKPGHAQALFNLGLIEEQDGNTAGALRLLEDARQRASRTTDAWVWGEAYTLEAGMVFSVEPGIYLPGVTGIRIEDIVALEATGPRLLTHSPREAISIG